MYFNPVSSLVCSQYSPALSQKWHKNHMWCYSCALHCGIGQLTAGQSKLLHGLTMGCVLGSKHLLHLPCNGLPCPLQCLLYPIATSENVGLQRFCNKGSVSGSNLMQLQHIVNMCVYVYVGGGGGKKGDIVNVKSLQWKYFHGHCYIATI